MSINIKSFDEFSKFKTEQTEIALENELNLKREENASTFKNLLSEYGVDSISSLSPEQKQEFYSRLEEGNAFGDAVRKAKEAGDEEFEFEGKTYKVTESITEAINVEGKRDAKKVVTVYNNIFNKSLVDFGAMPTESILGCIKYLMNEALHDANFHKEAEPTAKMIKGNIQPLEIKMPGLGGHFVKIGPKTIKEILDKYYSDIAKAAGWGGIGIVEGTALYLEQIKQEAMGQQVLNKFNTMFEGKEVRVDVEARINEAKVLEAAAWEIGKDYPSYGVVISVVHNNDLCEVTFDSGDKIVFRDTGSSWVQEATVTEAKFVKDFNRDVLKAKTKEEVLELYPNAEFFIGKSDHFFGELDGNLFFKAYYTKAQEEFEIKSVYSEKGSNYVHLYNESVVNESEAENILQDLLDERDGDMGELHDMSMEDALDTVEAYGHKGSKAKKIAKELVSMCNESVVTESDEPKCTNRKGHLYKQIDKDGTVECTHCGLRNSLSESVVTEAKKYEFKDLAKAWEFVYGEKMEDEYAGFYQEVTGKHKNKVTKEDIAKIWDELYGEDIATEYEGFFSSIKEAVNEDSAGRMELLKTGRYKDTKGKTHTLKAGQIGTHERIGWDGDFIHFGSKIFNSSEFGNDDIEVYESTVTESKIKVTKKDIKDIEDSGNIDIAYKKAMALLTSLVESVVNEAEINTDEEFKEYAFTVLKKAFQKDFDEAKANDVVDGILSKSEGDYGVAIGMLVNSLG